MCELAGESAHGRRHPLDELRPRIPARRRAARATAGVPQARTAPPERVIIASAAIATGDSDAAVSRERERRRHACSRSCTRRRHTQQR